VNDRPDEAATIEAGGQERPGATTAFAYDRLTVEHFRAAFPRARWRDDLRAWFVPGTTAQRRLDRWLGRELPGVLAYADERGKDAFAFDPVESRYLEAADDLRVRTPYSTTVVAELREVPWAWFDRDMKAWRVPFRSWEELRRRWPAIEAAAQDSEPEERQKRRDARKGSAEHAEAVAHGREMRRHRHPVVADALPPMDRVVMTRHGCVIFTEVTGELADDATVSRHYPGMPAPGSTPVWAGWHRPTHAELVKTWPAHRPPDAAELARGWWQPTLDELRDERRKARSIERAQDTRRQEKDTG
jgi:hypothetical protein